MITSPTNNKPLVVWQIDDSKPGHINQSLGLIQALGRFVRIDHHVIDRQPAGNLIWQWLTRRFPAGNGLPAPGLIVGAGHGTHATLLCAGRAAGGCTVVLMRPDLPLSWFDWCLIPAHDNPPPSANVITTTGTLNRIQPGGEHDPGSGVILVGGTSKHFHWDGASIVSQIEALTRPAGCRWQITDSRRTPADTRAALSRLNSDNVRYVPNEQTGPDWLPAQLATVGTVWVSEDSMSMIYEALTSGARVGLLELPSPASDRLAVANKALIRNGMVLPFSSWQTGQDFKITSPPLNEADRCARLLLEQTGFWIE